MKPDKKLMWSVKLLKTGVTRYFWEEEEAKIYCHEFWYLIPRLKEPLYR